MAEVISVVGVVDVVGVVYLVHSWPCSFIQFIYSLLMRTGSQRTVGVGGCAGAWNILEFGL